jgi:hypothetical protein
MKALEDWRRERSNKLAMEAPPSAPSAASDAHQPTWRTVALVGVKVVHTLAFFSIGSSLGYFAYSAVTKQSDRRAAIAGAVVTGEALIYAGNGWRCPLTGLAERLGATPGPVSDIYLPRWLASHIAEIAGPIFVISILLHASNVFRRGTPRHA